MATVQERLATSEAERKQLGAQVELLWQSKRRRDEKEEKRDAELEQLRRDVSKVCNWQKKFTERCRYYARVALFVGVAVGLQFASGAWARLFEAAARRLLQGFL